MFSKPLITFFKKTETPFYFYDLDLLNKTLEQVVEHGISRGFHIHYAIKANYNFKILHLIREAGLDRKSVV